MGPGFSKMQVPSELARSAEESPSVDLPSLKDAPVALPEIGKTIRSLLMGGKSEVSPAQEGGSSLGPPMMKSAVYAEGGSIPAVEKPVNSAPRLEVPQMRSEVPAPGLEAGPRNEVPRMREDVGGVEKTLSDRPAVGRDEYRSQVMPGPQQPELERALLSPELREKLKNLSWPDPEKLRTAPLDELKNVYNENRKVLEEVAGSLKDIVPGLALSGRGGIDLENIFHEKRGTYSGINGNLMVWAVRDALSMDPSALVNSLEQMCFRAVSYAMGFESRRAYDPEIRPGGVMVMLPDIKLSPRFKGADPLQRVDYEKNPVGEDDISLHPENFKRVVVGVVSGDRFVEQDKIESELSAIMKAAYDQKNPERYNAAYLRREVCMVIKAGSVLTDALNLLAEHPANGK